MAVADQQYEAYVQRHVRWNFLVNITDGGFFFLGMSFASVVTVLPLFVSQLTTSPFLIGLIPAIQNMGWLLPQLFTAPLVGRLPRKKPLVMLTTLSERLPFVGMVILSLMLPNLAVGTALAIFFALHIWRTTAAGITATPWQDMIGKIIPARQRGTFFGMQMGLGGLLGAGGAFLAGQILEWQPYPSNFALCFALTCGAMVVSFVALSFAREAPQTLRTTRQTGREFWGSLPRIIRANRDFRNFLVYRILYLLGGMGVAFYTVYVVDKFGMSKAQAGELTFAMMLAQTLTYPTMGWLGDRVGHRQVMQVAALTGTAMAALAWWAPSGVWFWGVYILFGVTSASAMVSNLSGVYDFAPVEERPTYIGLTATVIGVPAMIAPLVGAFVVQRFSHQTLFLLTAAICLAAFAVIRWCVRDPRRDEVDEDTQSTPAPSEAEMVEA